jgi:hypothetical protein
MTTLHILAFWLVTFAALGAFWLFLNWTLDLIGSASARFAEKAHEHPGTHNGRNNGRERSGERSH